MKDNWFSYAAQAHADFMALAKKVAMEGDVNDFEDYLPGQAEDELEPEVYEEDEDYDDEESDLGMELSDVEDPKENWSDVGSDPWAWAPHFCDLTEEMLDSMAGGMELGLPERVYINYSPRGEVDKLLDSSSGLYRE